MLGRTAPRATTRQGVGACAIALAAAAAYLPAFRAALVYDDHGIIEGSRLLRGPLWRIWVDASTSDYWPLTWSALWLQWRAWGDSAAGYHAVNIALHAAVAILLWRVLRRLEIPGAWLAGLLFAVHPVTVESVAWVSEQKNTLSALFFLGAILVWASPERAPRHRGLALLLFVLALLAKASVVMLPWVLVAISARQRRRLEPRAWVEAAPFFGIALALGLITVWFQHRNAMAGWAEPRGLVERVGGAGWALASYLETAFAPVRVAIVYPHWPVASGSPLYFAPLAGIIAVLATAWALRRRWSFMQGSAWALGYHAAMVLPVLGLADMAYLRIAPVANHLQYLALMGPAALVAAAFALWARRSPTAARASAAAVVVLLAAVTAARASAYASDLTLWERAVAEEPRSAWARDQLALVYLGEGRRADALREMAESARLARDPAALHRARGTLAFHAGEPAVAAAEARAVLGLTADPELRREAGWLLTQTGSAGEAVEVFAELVRRAPGSSDYAYWLAASLSRAGRLEEAEGVLRGWSAERPGHPQIEKALSFVLVRRGLEGEARRRAAALLGTDSNDARVDAWLADPSTDPR